MNKNTDTRFLKTQTSINNAFIQLMDEIGFSKITVTKIIEIAQINRSTFYSHYLDKFDLLNKIEYNLLMDFKKIALNNDIKELISIEFNYDTFYSYTYHLVNYMYENGKLFALLIIENDNTGFINKLTRMIENFWSEKDLNIQISIPHDYLVSAIIGMMSNLFIEWIKKDFRESPEAFSKIVMDVVKGIHLSFFN